MGSIGFDLGKWAKKGLMKFRSARSTMFGLETHLVTIHKLVEDFQPTAVVVDPITNLSAIGDTDEIKAMMMRIVDSLKNKQITSLFTSLTSGGSAFEQCEVGISSLMDTWILLRNIETDGERNRLLYILKSRGMAHSNQVREFILSDNGIALRDVYIGSGTVLTGSARMTQEAKDRSQELLGNQVAEHRQFELSQQHLALDAQIAVLKAQSEGIQKEMKELSDSGHQKNKMLHQQKDNISRIRKAD
jgi:circadian clock protein KaiC